jgi:diguanylate cyclase (GGDEF)-like protein
VTTASANALDSDPPPSRGHAAGDRILIEVASALRANWRAYDLVIRYGGDEFVVTISGLTVADAAKRFAAVNTALGEAPERGSVAIGLAELQPEDLPEELVARAYAALYQERVSGTGPASHRNHNRLRLTFACAVQAPISLCHR